MIDKPHTYTGGATAQEVSNKDMLQENAKRVLLFNPYMAWQAFSLDFINLEPIRAWVLQQIHPGGAFCPFCKNKITDKTTLNNFYNLKRGVCKSCGKWISATMGTALHHAGLDLKEIYLIAVFTAMNVDRPAIADILQCHPDTVKLWQAKFRAVEETL